MFRGISATEIQQYHDQGYLLVPGLLDRYLARTNYEAQQSEEPEDPDRPDNLWSPVPGDPGAHGPVKIDVAK